MHVVKSSNSPLVSGLLVMRMTRISMKISKYKQDLGYTKITHYVDDMKGYRIPRILWSINFTIIAIIMITTLIVT